MTALLCASAAPDTSNATSDTPLHLAAAAGHQPCVEALLRLRATVDPPDGQAWSPLWRAVQALHTPVVEFLTMHSADPTLPSTRVHDPWLPLV